MPLRNFRDVEQTLFELVQHVKDTPSVPSPCRYTGVNDPVATILGFEIKEQQLEGDDGLYISDPPGRNKPLVVIDPKGGDQERLNFTFFHEVTHHLIRSNNDIYDFLDQHATQNDDLKAIKEKLADAGAAEFLLPGKAIREVIDQKSFSIRLLLELDQSYPASKPAIAIQLARHASHKCFVIVCECGPIPPQSEGQAKLLTEGAELAAPNYLHVKYSASSPSNKYSIGRYVIIPQAHFLRKVFEEKVQYARGTDVIPFRSKKEWAVPCEAIYHKNKVYAVFNVETPFPPSSLQPGLFSVGRPKTRSTPRP